MKRELKTVRIVGMNSNNMLNQQQCVKRESAARKNTLKTAKKALIINTFYGFTCSYVQY